MLGEDLSLREPLREEIDQIRGPILLEFGASWCPHCQAMAPKVADILRDYPTIQFIRIEDGPGKVLGRSFRVKLWPSFVFLKDGEVIKQLARPGLEEVRNELELIAGAR